MSRNAHEKSLHKLRKLPRCTKCKTEFVLVSYQEEGTSKLQEEWECPKCRKSVPKEMMSEEPPGDFEAFLHKKCKVLNEQEQRRSKRSTR